MTFPSMDDTFIERPRGLPRWIIWACMPVALALGLVAGLGVATYRAVPGEFPAQPDPTGGAPGKTGQGTGTTPGGPGPANPIGLAGGGATTGWEASWEIPGLNRVPYTPEPQFPDGRAPQGPPLTNPASPTNAYGTPAANAQAQVLQARAQLAAGWGTFTTPAGKRIEIDYEAWRGAHGGLVLVGMINMEEYFDWAEALKLDQAALQKWLDEAAAAARRFAQKEGFHLAFAVVENPKRSPPAEFATHEVTPLSDRTYLIIRPLAATLTADLKTIAIRPLTDMTVEPVATARDPWAAYGPRLRFDSTDIYRPTTATPVRR